MILGRRHALRRVRAGRKPIFSTAWLLSRQERGLPPRMPAWPAQPVYVHYAPGPNGGGPQGGGGWYHMQNMPPPPPVYDANLPPMYDDAAGVAPGAGTTKVDPNQQGGAAEYAPPAGPPPGR